MLIVCPTCETSYNLSVESLGANGRSVRCVRCKEVWHAQASREAKLLAAVDALGPESESQPNPGDFAAPAADQSLEAGVAAPQAGDPTAEDDRRDDWGGPSAEAAHIDDRPPDAPQAADGQHDSFEVEAPPLVPVDLDHVRPLHLDAAPTPEPAQTGEFEDIETLAARRRRGKPRRLRLAWPLTALQTAMVALIIADAALIGWRNGIVRLFPQTASFYALIGMPVNLRGLAFDGIATTTEQQDGVPVLVVEGNVLNVARKPLEVPRLRIAVRNDTGQEIYSWTMVPPRTVLPAGETLAFRSRLASPPPEGRDVLVRFFARRDIVAGMK